VPNRESEFEEVLRSPEGADELFRRFYRPIVAFFVRRGFSDEEGRDLAQETFFRVFKHIEGYRGESSVETWIFQIASNLYKNTLRSQITYKRDAAEVPLSLPDDAEVASLGQGERSDPLGSLLTGERARLLREALNELPPQMRRCVILRVEHDLKYREIAQLMGVSIETVKAHLYQARQVLRDKLADLFTDEES